MGNPSDGFHGKAQNRWRDVGPCLWLTLKEVRGYYATLHTSEYISKHILLKDLKQLTVCRSFQTQNAFLRLWFDARGWGLQRVKVNGACSSENCSEPAIAYRATPLHPALDGGLDWEVKLESETYGSCYNDSMEKLIKNPSRAPCESTIAIFMGDERHIPTFCNFSQAINRFSSHFLLPRSICHMYPIYAHFPFWRCLKKELPKSIQIPSQMIELATSDPSTFRHCQTLSVTIRNFWASAELWESAQLRPGGEWVMATGERLKDFYQIPIRLASMAVSKSFLKRKRISRRFFGTTLDIGGRDLSPQRPKFQLELWKRNPPKFIVWTLLFSQRFGRVKLNFRNILVFYWQTKTRHLQAESIFYGHIYTYIYYMYIWQPLSWMYQ